MRNVTEIGNEWSKRLKDIGIPVSGDVAYCFNSRFVRRWGQCKRSNGKFTIEISAILLRDDVPLTALENTIIHELIHTAPNCSGHGATWQKYAELVRKKLNYNIQRVDSCEDKGVSISLIKELHPPKYTVVCQKCGAQINRYKTSDLVKYPQLYKHKCGGRFKVFKND